MAQQDINVGSAANDRSGDSIRAAFQKINANFTELYTALGLDELPLNLGAFEFTGSVITTTDSSSVTIDQSVTVSSDLTVGGDVVPSVANGGDLGSLAKPWRSLYVSSSTVYFGGVPLSLDENNNLLVDDVPISQTIIYADIPDAPAEFSGSYADLTNKPTIPADIGDLTDTGNLLSSGSADSLTNNDDINITINNDDSSSYTWNFGQTGTLTAPGDITLDGVVKHSTIEKTGGANSGTATALDLTKSVQVLVSADADDDSWSLADGVEGQIMYFVPKGAGLNNHYINIANVRYFSEGGYTVGPKTWIPFQIDDNLRAEDWRSLAVAVFTDGAWNTDTSWFD
jgi:hypothetical protein